MTTPTLPLLGGVYAAALTPLHSDGTLAPEQAPALLAFLAQRGCHGALLLGTTGEGPSFAVHERQALMQAAVQVRQDFPDFRLFAGTGTPSLEETILLTRMAFDLGLDGVVVLPPYYFRKASDEGLFAWFAQVLQRAVPSNGSLFGYHIPAISGVGLSLDLLGRLLDNFPGRFAGLKDSSGDPEHARQLGARFGDDLLVFTGNDRLFSHALQHGAKGCITALANLYSPDLRCVWDAYQRGESDERSQARLNAARAVLDRHPPAPPLLKAMIARRHAFAEWPVRPPLIPLTSDLEDQIAAEFELGS